MEKELEKKRLQYRLKEHKNYFYKTIWGWHLYSSLINKVTFIKRVLSPKTPISSRR